MNQDHAAIATNTYLSRLAFEQQSRTWIRRSCDVLVDAEISSHTAGAVTYSRMHVHMISEFGMVATACRDDIPDCFCLSVGSAQYHIACAVMHRQDRRLHIRFIKQQPESFITQVASLTDPNALLGVINPDVYGLPEDVKPPAAKPYLT